MNAPVMNVKALLNLHPALTDIGNGRVKCTLTNHEMLANKNAILQHVNGKKYKRLALGFDQFFSYEQYEPHLVPSDKEGHAHQLFCKLTLRHINKVPQHVERHVNGRKYLRAKIKWDECQKTGEKFIPTPLQNCRKKKAEEECDFEYNTLDKSIENSDSDTDSFSDLYPEKYFEKLQLESEEEEAEAMITKKCKQKKKKSGVKKSVSSNVVKSDISKKKRKVSFHDHVKKKKQRLNKPLKKTVAKKSDLVLFT